MLTAAFMFAAMGAFVKIASETINSVEIVFFRNVFGLLLIVASFKTMPVKQTGGRPWLLLSRGLFGTVALFAVFYNLGNISLAKSVTFVQTSPIFTALFAALFLKERLSRQGWFAIFFGFLGILLITKPEGLLLQKTDYLGILSGVLAAAAYTSIRELKKYYDTRVIVLSFMLTGTVLPLIMLLLGNVFDFDTKNLDFLLAAFVMPRGTEWLWIVGVGATALLGQYLITKAYSYAKAGTVATIGYSNIIFASLIGYMMGDGLPDTKTLIGIAIIVACGILATRKN